MGILYASDDSPLPERNYDNVYAIVIDKKIYIQHKTANVSLYHFSDQFCEKMANEEIADLQSKGGRLSPERIDKIRKRHKERTVVVRGFGGVPRTKTISVVDAVFHFLIDLQVKTVNVVSSSFPGGGSPQHIEKMKEMVFAELWRFIEKQRGLKDFRVIEDDIVPYMDYMICKIKDFPGVVSYITRNNLGIDIDLEHNILLMDCGVKKIREVAASKIGYTGSDFVSERPFTYEYEGNPIFDVDAPFIFINSDQKNMFAVTRSICRVLIDSTSMRGILGESDRVSASIQVLDYLRKKTTMDFDIGRSVGECMHELLSSSIHSGGILRHAQFDRIDQLIESYGAQNDERMKRFIKSFYSFINIFPSMKHDGSDNDSERKLYDYGQYYYFCEAPDEVKYPSFFDKVFRITESQVRGETRYDCLMSKYSIPLEAVEMFGYQPISVSKFEKKMNVLIGSLEHGMEASRRGQQPAMERLVATLSEGKTLIQMSEDLGLVDSSNEASIREFMESFRIPIQNNEPINSLIERFERFGSGAWMNREIIQEWIGRVQSNSIGVMRQNEDVDIDRIERRPQLRGVVKMLSDFPMVFSYVQRMFDGSGVDYNDKLDIPVTIVVDYSDPNGRGTYSSRRSGGGGSYLTGRDSIFSPPEITMNLVSLKNIERMMQSLLHEASHYLDDIKQNMGILPPDYMKQPTGEGLARMRSYYRDVETEYKARVVEIFSQLMHYSQETVRDNDEALKMFFVNQMMGRSGVSSTPLAVDANNGDETITVEGRGIPLRESLSYDVAEEGDIQKYIIHGESERRHETVTVVNIDQAEDGQGFVLTLDRPLSMSHSVSKGASLFFPDVESHPFYGTRQELFGLIINEAFNHYLTGGTLANIPSKPTVKID